MKVKVPKRFSGVLHELEKSEMTMFFPESGEMGFWKRLEREVGNDKLMFVFDKATKKAVALKNSSIKIKKKKKTGKIKSEMFEIELL